MTFDRRQMLAALVAALLLSLPRLAIAQTPAGPDIYSIARDAYLYAYPLVSMEATMRQATNAPNATAVFMRAPVNQFAQVRTYPKADSKVVVRTNFDTLYSSAFLDLTREPMVLSVPDTGGRYYLLEMLDMWSDVFSVVGARTTGTKAGNYALVAAHWSGTLPADMTRIVAPTPAIWILGRTQTNGPTDYDNVHKVQDGYKLTPLSRWGTAYASPKNMRTDPSIDDKTPPKQTVDQMDGVTTLTRLAALMGKYPPHPNDYPILFRMRALGIEPGKPFDSSKLDASTVAIINKAAKDALEDMSAGIVRLGKIENGWNVLTQNIGTYGTSYQQRALIASGGLGANLPEDAIYPTAFFDADGQPLTGANKYVVHFDKGKTPPANAFWSITMYDKDGFQVPNPINRFAIGDRDKLAFNADGSLDIYVQADSPGADKESNWLPAPRDAPFQPTMRLYSPRPDVANGTWQPPGLQKVN